MTDILVTTPIPLNSNVTVVNPTPLNQTDHGALTGLGDDDHPHYLTQGRGDARYIRTINGLPADIAGDITVANPGGLTIADNGDGTLTLGGNSITDNLDGTLTLAIGA